MTVVTWRKRPMKAVDHVTNCNKSVTVLVAQ